MTKVCVEFDPDNGENPEPGPSFKTYATTIGDGSSLNYTVSHGLGTRDVLYSLRNLATGAMDGYDATVTSLDNSLSIVFATAPASQSVRVVVGAVKA